MFCEVLEWCCVTVWYELTAIIAFLLLLLLLLQALRSPLAAA
jgi:hypothetical protein